MIHSNNFSRRTFQVLLGTQKFRDLYVCLWHALHNGNLTLQSSSCYICLIEDQKFTLVCPPFSLFVLKFLFFEFPTIDNFAQNSVRRPQFWLSACAHWVRFLSRVWFQAYARKLNDDKWKSDPSRISAVGPTMFRKFIELRMLCRKNEKGRRVPAVKASTKVFLLCFYNV